MRRHSLNVWLCSRSPAPTMTLDIWRIAMAECWRGVPFSHAFCQSLPERPSTTDCKAGAPPGDGARIRLRHNLKRMGRQTSVEQGEDATGSHQLAIDAEAPKLETLPRPVHLARGSRGLRPAKTRPRDQARTTRHCHKIRLVRSHSRGELLFSTRRPSGRAMLLFAGSMQIRWTLSVEHRGGALPPACFCRQTRSRAV